SHCGHGADRAPAARRRRDRHGEERSAGVVRAERPVRAARAAHGCAVGCGTQRPEFAEKSVTTKHTKEDTRKSRKRPSARRPAERATKRKAPRKHKHAAARVFAFASRFPFRSRPAVPAAVARAPRQALRAQRPLRSNCCLFRFFRATVSLTCPCFTWSSSDLRRASVSRFGSLLSAR